MNGVNDLQKYSDEELMLLMDSDIQQELKQRGYEFGWYRKIQYAGVIYILVNPAFLSLVKIGYTDNIEARLKTLNRDTGLPDPYHVYATYKVKKRLEDLKLHALIDSLDSDLRHAKNKEFYEMTPEKAYDVLSAIAEINGDEELLIKNPLNDSYFDTVTVQTKKDGNDKAAVDGSASATDGKKKRSRLTFKMIGIPVGSTLVYKDDPTVVVKTADEASNVVYQGKTYTISGVVNLLKKGGSWQGGDYFTYKGKKLTVLRREIEKK